MRRGVDEEGGYADSPPESIDGSGRERGTHRVTA
jgi:hypothetical protein